MLNPENKYLLMLTAVLVLFSLFSLLIAYILHRNSDNQAKRKNLQHPAFKPKKTLRMMLARIFFSGNKD